MLFSICFSSAVLHYLVFMMGYVLSLGIFNCQVVLPSWTSVTGIFVVFYNPC